MRYADIAPLLNISKEFDYKGRRMTKENKLNMYNKKLDSLVKNAKIQHQRLKDLYSELDS